MSYYESSLIRGREIGREWKTLLSILEELEKNDKENTTKTREEYGNRKEDR